MRDLIFDRVINDMRSNQFHVNQDKCFFSFTATVIPDVTFLIYNAVALV